MVAELFKSATVDAAPSSPIEFPNLVHFPAAQPGTELQKIIDELGLIKHIEGGYFKETDRSPFVANFGSSKQDAPETSTSVSNASAEQKSQMPTDSQLPVYTDSRHYHTLIYYLLTPDAPMSKMIMNTSRNIHILQRGRGQYVLVYPDGTVKSFKVGFDTSKGEVSQWVVPGGVYKASFLLPNKEFNNGLLISEVVVPGFEYSDFQQISSKDELESYVGPETANILGPLL
ncbi:LAMI_0G09252g1_1 [Lachancea mirantina]|uniref:LAMI_0G09252g1_1 n=1 Tax=Lachancea mirantina TaxID=1230905 RepID=A0A1G4KA61_9SACH|nr:LAMI_0G09252g1_1 [Lachancea mirantina]